MSYIKLTSFENGSIGDLDIYLNTKCIKLIERSVVHGDDTGTRIELFGIPIVTMSVIQFGLQKRLTKFFV